MALRMTLLK